jgi:hypothetical protein
VQVTLACSEAQAPLLMTPLFAIEKAQVLKFEESRYGLGSGLMFFDNNECFVENIYVYAADRSI